MKQNDLVEKDATEMHREGSAADKVGKKSLPMEEAKVESLLEMESLAVEDTDKEMDEVDMEDVTFND